MSDLIESMIREALDYEAVAFDRDDDVNGADLVEWFARWRERARVAINPASAQQAGGGHRASRRWADQL